MGRLEVKGSILRSYSLQLRDLCLFEPWLMAESSLKLSLAKLLASPGRRSDRRDVSAVSS